MPEDEGAGGNFLTARIMGIPAIIWIAGAGILAYFLFFRNSGSSSNTSGQPQGGSATGGSGTINTGATTIDSGAVQISVTAPNGAPQPTTTTGTTTTSQQLAVSDITEQAKNGSAAAIEWRPPQFPSGSPTNTTYTFGISPAPKGGSSAAHNIGSRTSYNVGGLQKGTKYTVTVTPNVAGGVPATKTFSFS
jgi:Fibronectin type III domain